MNTMRLYFSLICIGLCLVSGTATTEAQVTTHSQPAVAVFASQEELGYACARLCIDLIKARQQEGLTTVLGLATGSTQIPFYRTFVQLAKLENVDLSTVTTFNLDEYVGLPPDHPESYHQYMQRNLFDELMECPTRPLGLRACNLHLPNGYAKTVEDLSTEENITLYQEFPNRELSKKLSTQEELWILRKRATAYDSLIDSVGPIHLQVLGIGVNGHIGFAEPGSPFDGGTTIVELTASTREANQRFFANEEVPTHAISMGIGTILKAQRILLLATGVGKSSIVAKALIAPISEEIPATALREHPDVTYLLDEESAKWLQ